MYKNKLKKTIYTIFLFEKEILGRRQSISQITGVFTSLHARVGLGSDQIFF